MVQTQIKIGSPLCEFVNQRANLFNLLTPDNINISSKTVLTETKSYRNNRALGPCVAHLRMTVYKGIGNHSSSQCPAMNFDRSAVSLRLNMGYADKNNRM